MDEKRKLLETETPKHKKKSKRKGQPRADHKHKYKTVLLLREYMSKYFSDQATIHKHPTKVCVICGRVGYVDMSQYDLVEIPDDLPHRVYQRVIRDEESLEKWYVDDYFDKFAKKLEEFKHEKE